MVRPFIVPNPADVTKAAKIPTEQESYLIRPRANPLAWDAQRRTFLLVLYASQLADLKVFSLRATKGANTLYQPEADSIRQDPSHLHPARLAYLHRMSRCRDGLAFLTRIELISLLAKDADWVI